MLEVQRLLRMSNDKLNWLKDELSLTIREHESDGRVLLKYSQIDSPMGHPVVQECRGLILDRNDNWNVVSMGFHKFFNYGEGHAAKIDWNNATVFEKVDGSLITAYFYNGDWHVQTTGTIMAEGPVSYYDDLTFARLFRDTFGKDKFDLLDPSRFYTFELATMFNRIVTRYEQDHVVLLAIRDKETLQELSFDDAEYQRIGVRLPNRFDISSVEGCVQAANELEMLQEGYVVCDNNFNRIKIKSPAYVAIHHLKDSENTMMDKFLTIARTNEGDEFLNYFPEYTEIYERVKVEYLACLTKLEAIWDTHKDIEVQKDFALAIMADKHPFAKTLFRVRNTEGMTVRDAFGNIESKKIVKELGLKKLLYLTKDSEEG